MAVVAVICLPCLASRAFGADVLSACGLFFGMSKLLSKPISIISLGTKRAGQVTMARFALKSNLLIPDAHSRLILC